MDDETLAGVARALAHPARVRIIRLLSTQSECRGADVFSGLPLAQSTISEHLRVLKEAGLVNARPEGTSMVYCVVPAVLDGFATSIRGMAEAAPGCLAGKESRGITVERFDSDRQPTRGPCDG